MIIVDNNSTDNTEEVIKNFNDRRISIVKIANHGIIAKSRNFGVNLAKGHLIAFLDSDDWWVPKNTIDKDIRKVYNEMKKNYV